MIFKRKEGHAVTQNESQDVGMNVEGKGKEGLNASKHPKFSSD